MTVTGPRAYAIDLSARDADRVTGRLDGHLASGCVVRRTNRNSLACAALIGPRQNVPASKSSLAVRQPGAARSLGRPDPGGGAVGEGSRPAHTASCTLCAVRPPQTMLSLPTPHRCRHPFPAHRKRPRSTSPHTLQRGLASDCAVAIHMKKTTCFVFRQEHSLPSPTTFAILRQTCPHPSSHHPDGLTRQLPLHARYSERLIPRTRSRRGRPAQPPCPDLVQAPFADNMALASTPVCAHAQPGRIIGKTLPSPLAKFYF